MSELFYVILDWVSIFLQTAIYAVYSHAILRAKKYPALTILVQSAVCIVSYILMAPINHLLYLRIPINAGLILLLTFLLYRGSWKLKILVYVTEVLINYLADFSSTLFLSAVFPNATEFDYTSPTPIRGIGFLFCFAMMLVLYTAGIILFRKWYYKVEGRELYWFLLFPIHQLFLLGGIFHGAGAQNGEWAIVFGLICLVFGIVVDVLMFRVMKSISEKARAEERLAFLDTMQEANESYYKLIEKYLEDTKTVRHDFRDQLQTAIGLIGQSGSERSQEALDLLGEVGERIGEIGAAQLCENRVVNTVVMAKQALAGEKDVQISCALSVPENIGIGNMDLCTLFANILNNAIEACEQNPEDRRTITIKSASRGGFLTVRAENYVLTEPVIENNTLKTTKTDAAHHGFGTEQIRAVAKKYNGEVKYECRDHLFCVTVQLEEKA